MLVAIHKVPVKAAIMMVARAVIEDSVNLDQTRAASNVVFHSDLEAKRAFVGGAGLFIVLVSSYALLECWRECALDKHKDRPDGNDSQ